MLPPSEEARMLRALLRFVLILVVVVAAAAFFFGYRWGGGRPSRATSEPGVTPQPGWTSGARAETTRGKTGAARAEGGGKNSVGTPKASGRIQDDGPCPEGHSH